MMNEIIAFFILLMGGCVGVIDAAEGAASITGRVVITKVMTKKRVVLPSYDMRGMTVNSASPAASSAVGSVADELSRVVLYLEGPGLRNPAPLQGTLVQKNRHFDPDLLVIPVGSTVSFPNDDPIFHNVFSLSKVKQFDLGYYPAGETRTVKFEKPGIVQVYCHIHPDMSAAIVVLATSFWTRKGVVNSLFPRSRRVHMIWWRGIDPPVFFAGTSPACERHIGRGFCHSCEGSGSQRHHPARELEMRRPVSIATRTFLLTFIALCVRFWSPDSLL